MLEFVRTKVDSLMGGVEVRYTVKEVSDDTFSVVADIRGIQLRGKSPHIAGVEDLESLAQVISLAYEQHRKLQPNFMVNTRGH